MLKVVEISVKLELVEGAVVTFGDSVELALDCHICRRGRRTVSFRTVTSEGRCLVTGHSFPGKLVAKSSTDQSASYRVEYQFEPFQDSRFKGVQELSPAPTWAKIEFTVVCPACGKSRRFSTHTCAVRPFHYECQCGTGLYTDGEGSLELSVVE